MESNREEAYRCIELTKLYIKKKNLDQALKFSIKANKLYPTTETKCLMKKLTTSLKESKQQKESAKKKSDDSDSSYNGDNSSTSSTNSCDSQNREQPKKKSKRSSKSSTAYSFKMFKEINKDESQKCLEKAEKYLQTKEYETAEKFVLKSKKLFPLPEADVLLKKIQEIKEINKPTYTEEQAKFVKKVKNSENYYKMLDIKTTATVPEIKKAFKKLALLIHPDKNSAPESGEVFIVVTNAVETLCDHSKRLIYDRTLRTRARTTPLFNLPYRRRMRRTNRSWHLYRYDNMENSYTSYQSSPSSSDSNEFSDQQEYYDSYDYYNSFSTF
ncbi:DnaJ domain,Tetratricopeptide-like helical domain [Cinara cedri]|uniref:DnaJ domain,Tetratricopeptide-like helical domain n=1 Tax=Cinara cedri TaxID=506608 RepID=A0A5E4N458_9HEMI|nr:DnaJ domain,Tetratricopeptide-like helical domain [Cinara cedri]